MSRKLHAHIAPYMDLQKNVLMNAFFNLQFNHCRLIWMCHRRTVHNKINKLHDRRLRLIYSDKTLEYLRNTLKLHKIHKMH